MSGNELAQGSTFPYTMEHQSLSLISSPTKKLPRRRSSTMNESSLQASVLSTNDKKKSSSRRKKQDGGGGLGIFLSKYDGKKEKQQARNKGNTLFSSGGSCNGSVGTESTSSKKSITSMPARLPLMFSRSGRSDRKEAALAKGQKQGMGKSNDSEHASSSTSSSTTRRSTVQTSSYYTPSSLIMRTRSVSPSRKFLSRCSSFDGYEPKAPKDDESNSLSHNYHESPRRGMKKDASSKIKNGSQDTSSSHPYTPRKSPLSIATTTAARPRTTPSSSPAKKYLSRCASFDGYETKTSNRGDSSSFSHRNHESPRQAMKQGAICKDRNVLSQDISSSSHPNTPRQSPRDTSSYNSSLARATYHGEVLKTPRRDADDKFNMTQSDHGPGGASPTTTPRRVRPSLNRGGLIPSPLRRVNPNFGIDQYLGDRVTRSYEQLLFDFQDSSSSFEVDASLVLSDVPLLAQPEEKTKCLDMSEPVQGVHQAPPPGSPLAPSYFPEKEANRNVSGEGEEAIPRNCPECIVDTAEEECLLPPELNRHISEESLACPFQRPPEETRQVNHKLAISDDLLLDYFSILKEFDDSAGAICFF
jgi:hypothetical protein